MTIGTGSGPLGVRLMCGGGNPRTKYLGLSRTVWFKIYVWAFTFVIYTFFHMTRKPLSVVKNVLVKNCTAINSSTPHINSSTWCDWAPFDGSDSSQILGVMDSVYLFSYAFGMFFSGPIAERMDLRVFLTFGLGLSGLMAALFGIAYPLKIHSLWFFIIMQLLAGLTQSTGWPSVVAVIGNWFGRKRRGIIFGVWNSHTHVGNILGSVIAGAFLDSDWGLSFYVPGVMSISLGAFAFFFLTPAPEEVNCDPPPPEANELQKLEAPTSYTDMTNKGLGTSAATDEFQHQQTQQNAIKSVAQRNPINFWQALKIPGVVEYSMCLFFTKLVCYTFLFWLPKYINDSTNFGAEESADLSALFDVGGIIGAILVGWLSDHTGANALTSGAMLIIGLPLMYLYQAYGNVSLTSSIVLLILSGTFVNAPYALITTSVSADLGTHECLNGNEKAIATVSAIIDGTGSIGSAVGPLLAGWISAYSWKYVFDMLLISSVLAILLLTRLFIREIKDILKRRRRQSTSGQQLYNVSAS